jgi:prophage regulatory protein
MMQHYGSWEVLVKRIIREKELIKILGVSRATIHRWLKAGTFPQAIRLSQGIKGWPETTVEEFIAKRMAG